MPTFKLIVAYDGTGYAGWQVQSGRTTVQGTLEEVLAQITGEEIRAMATSRTDAGVHALGQVVSFKSQTRLAPDVLQRALNAELPDDIAVSAVEIVDDSFYALRDAVRKRYRYTLHDGPIRPVLERHRAWHVFYRLDEDAMRRAAQALVGEHDFASFATTGSDAVTTVRTVFDLAVERGRGVAAEFITIEIEADGFLYNMVRNIVGALVDVGRGAKAESGPAEILAARDRRVAGQAAPAAGLTLLKVTCRGEEGS